MSAAAAAMPPALASFTTKRSEKFDDLVELLEAEQRLVAEEAAPASAPQPGRLSPSRPGGVVRRARRSSGRAGGRAPPLAAPALVRVVAKAPVGQLAGQQRATPRSPSRPSLTLRVPKSAAAKAGPGRWQDRRWGRAARRHGRLLEPEKAPDRLAGLLAGEIPGGGRQALAARAGPAAPRKRPRPPPGHRPPAGRRSARRGRERRRRATRGSARWGAPSPKPTRPCSSVIVTTRLANPPWLRVRC